MYQIQVSAQTAGIIPDRAGAGTVIILNINGRMACGTIHPCRQRHTGNLCSQQVTLQTDEAIAAAAFRRGSTGNTAVVIVTEMTALNAETGRCYFHRLHRSDGCGSLPESGHKSIACVSMEAYRGTSAR
ncbi:Uncharacterised protein [Escherichia coli]|nr:Uncharacterised protein [Escherichia coli]